jgi:photosystem II CP47 chlorophyll apoprotein
VFQSEFLAGINQSIAIRLCWSNILLVVYVQFSCAIFGQGAYLRVNLYQLVYHGFEVFIATNSFSLVKIRLPWFRVHIVILNDPGRLISVHIMHSGFAAGWSGVMVLYELITVDPTDPVYNPIWRQGCLPFIFAQLSGLSVLAAFWHWAYWDLNVFVSSLTGKLVLDLNQIIGIHVSLASLLCFGFGLAHVSGFLGPGMWTSDSFGVVGSIRFVKPIYSVIGLAPFCYGVISSNHIVAGFFGICIGLWHISSRPGPLLYKLLKMGNVEEVLSSSIAAVFFTAFVISALMWYGCVSGGLELFGPSRYHWDNGYFSLDIERRVNLNNSIFLNKAWEQVPEKLVLYDYIGCNPSKGGLFRSGPILLGDGIIQNWLGHASFEIGTLSLSIRRMPAFFETFPVILIDQGGNIRADIPFLMLNLGIASNKHQWFYIFQVVY